MQLRSLAFAVLALSAITTTACKKKPAKGCAVSKRKLNFLKAAWLAQDR